LDLEWSKEKERKKERKKKPSILVCCGIGLQQSPGMTGDLLHPAQWVIKGTIR